MRTFYLKGFSQGFINVIVNPVIIFQKIILQNFYISLFFITFTDFLVKKKQKLLFLIIKNMFLERNSCFLLGMLQRSYQVKFYRQYLGVLSLLST